VRFTEEKEALKYKKKIYDKRKNRKAENQKSGKQFIG
jgi:hypothetical protein